MEEDLKKEETMMDAKLIENPTIHKMNEEIQEKQDIESIETPIVVQTDFSKDEEQQLDCSKIRAQGHLEKKAKTLKIIAVKFHNFLPSQMLQTCKSRQPKLKSRQNCTVVED
ncbi:hypothetical protein L3X38_027781 [Prunus dulcis]|uniref:Uncharacterized protein n=1 Tax=Prunus dulcis TaxID=3755 RepID=A0AAD4VQ38_PRUDU|nr:hypothetical protein L3X38_027781 [Prunus dulcis]